MGSSLLTHRSSAGSRSNNSNQRAPGPDASLVYPHPHTRRRVGWWGRQTEPGRPYPEPLTAGVDVVVDDGLVVGGGNVVIGVTIGITVVDVVTGTVGVVPEGDVAGGTVVVVVVVGATPVSGDVHPEGGSLGPVWPGMSTVPAQPKLVRLTFRRTVPPSEKVATESTSRMNPELSTDTSSVVPL